MDTVTLNITSPPNVVTLNVISGASYVTNSNGSINYIVGSGETLVLPDILFTDSDGTQYYLPAGIDITATPCIMTQIAPVKMVLGQINANVPYPIVHNLNKDNATWQFRNAYTTLSFGIERQSATDPKNIIEIVSPETISAGEITVYIEAWNN